MESRLEIPARVRLSRHTQSFNATVDDSRDFALTHASGRSRDSDTEDDADSTSTARLARSKMSVDSYDGPPDFSAQAQGLSTPAPDAALMRAIRGLPPSSATPVPRMFGNGFRRPISPTSSIRDSDLESEFDTPRATNGVAATPHPANNPRASPPMSVEHERLSAIFNRARRDPGNTPMKTQRSRTASIESSVAEVSPIKWSKFGESLLSSLSVSGDEPEQAPSNSDERRFGAPAESSRAGYLQNYNRFRERTANPNLKDSTSTITKSERTIDMEDATEIEQELLSEQETKSRPSTPPTARATQRSISQFPSHFLGSNLMGDSTDIHKLIRDAAPTESESEEAITARPIVRRSPKKNGHGSRFYSIPRQESLESLSSVSSTASLPTDRRIQDGGLVTTEGSQRERSRLSTYMELHGQSQRPFIDRKQSSKTQEEGSIAGPSGLNGGRLSPVSIDVTESAVESSNQGSGSTVKGKSPLSSPKPTRINGDLKSRPRTHTSPRKSKSSVQLGTPSEHVSHVSLRPKEHWSSDARDSAAKPRAYVAAERDSDVIVAKSSTVTDHMDFHESDLDSFHEEDIVASSSVARLNGGGLSLMDDEDQFKTAVIESNNSAEHPDTENKPEAIHKSARSERRNFSPPPTPPKETSDPISTPKRGQNLTSTTFDWQTPSPPKGMPALPDPPSDDATDSIKLPPPARVPFTPVQNNRSILNAKTPRPPGAWATPFSKPPVSLMRTRSGESVGEKANALPSDVIYTPPASYSRATSMMMKTPALPGAWLPTPGLTAAKRAQQRVRFDEPESLASSPDPLPEESASEESQADGSVVIKSLGRQTQSPRSPRRMRVLDAFGNEITQIKPEHSDNGNGLGKVHSKGTMAAAVKGRQVSEKASAGEQLVKRETVDDKKFPTLPKVRGDRNSTNEGRERNDALRQLKASIAALKDEFNEMEDSFDNKRFLDLDQQLAKSHIESERASKRREQLWAKIKRSESRTLSGTILGYLKSGLQTSKILMIVFIVQFILLLALSRLSVFHARRLFLTKYIDPFYPQVDLHLFHADLYHRSLTSPSTDSSWTDVAKTLCSHLSELLATVLETSHGWRDSPKPITWATQHSSFRAV